MVVVFAAAVVVVATVVAFAAAVVAVAAGVSVPVGVVTVAVTDGVPVPVGGAVGAVTFPPGMVHPAARTPALTMRSATRRITLGLMGETISYVLFINSPGMLTRAGGRAGRRR
ncbi:hypothetical protein MchiMG62_13820 [Methanoculleus chikugoensis]|uniref:Uncharacterized protein n=1 Tax=Methanoculleus chikugoensis TaxID=118126 RepID=A0ABM7H6E5_9EURY|nr:hypothetical protein MchiMG62_13820 [Methanoculleus chikugoensis]